MHYRQAAGVVKREIAGEVFLVPVKQRLADMQNLFVLHGAGEFIWDQLEEPTGVGELADKISSVHEVAPEAAEHDARDFLAELLREGLATTVE